MVASEVKNLATQTAKATEEIAGQVKAIQDSTATAAQAIETISVTINRVSEISTTIASAIEEQGAATQEISRNVQEASAGTAEVASNISGVTVASQQTSVSSTQVLSAAAELGKNGDRLKKEVEPSWRPCARPSSPRSIGSGDLGGASPDLLWRRASGAGWRSLGRAALRLRLGAGADRRRALPIEHVVAGQRHVANAARHLHLEHHVVVVRNDSSLPIR